MNYFKNTLSALAAIILAEVVFVRPFLAGSQATGLYALLTLFVEGFLSPKFWVVGILLFALFFAASRGNIILRVVFFWIPTLLVSALTFAVIGLIGYVEVISRHH